MRSRILVLVLCLLAFGPVSAQTQFEFSDFSDVAALSLNGDTAVDSNALRLTPSLNGQSGSAFYGMSQIDFTLNFSTAFLFRISNSAGISDTCGGGIGGDGFTFAVQNDPAGALAVVPGNVGTGGFLGYQGITNSAAVEFDTFCDPAAENDPNSNHVAVVVLTTDHGAATNATHLPLPVDCPTFDKGQVNYVWIDYDAGLGTLEVRVSDLPTRPAIPTLTNSISLAAKVGGSFGYVGFTAGTGAASEKHEILSWDFCSYIGSEIGDSDSDGISDCSDVCPSIFSGPGGSFGQVIRASMNQQITTFEWPVATDWFLATGTFATSADFFILDFLLAGSGTDMFDVANPPAGLGFWYLIKPDCPAGSYNLEPRGSQQGDRDVLP